MPVGSAGGSGSGRGQEAQGRSDDAKLRAWSLMVTRRPCGSDGDVVRWWGHQRAYYRLLSLGAVRDRGLREMPYRQIG